MTHTTVTSLTTDFEANLDGGQLDTVFFASIRTMGVGVVGAWDTVNFDRPFEYNGRDNLLVEVTWNGLGEGDEDAVLQYGFSPDGTYRRAWFWDWQADTAERADNHAYNTLIGFENIGIIEVGSGRIPRRLETTFARSTFRLQGSETARLLDTNGRTVADLAPGENDVRHLVPGVYFVAPRGRPVTAKVIVPR